MRNLIKGLKLLAILVLLFVIGIVIFFGHGDIPVEELKSKYVNSESSFIALDGMNVHFRDEGNPTDSIPIVLLHGTASSLHTFDAWTNELKKTNRVVRLDLPAYGLTGPFPEGQYSIAHYTEFLKDFLSALKIKNCVLAGNSLGGEIAWNFALKQPEMVEKLILIDAAGFPLNPKSIPIGFKVAQIPVLKNIFTFITPRFLVKSSVENVFFDKSKVTDALVDRYFNLTLRAGNRQAFVDRFKMSEDLNTYDNLKNIQQPTLIIWGAEDLLIPIENAYKFQESIPNSTLVILENSGHTPMEESPSESLKLVKDFLKNKTQ
ncbi:MAG: alpha/beta hydrolase [Gelidibacter sp.]